MPAQCRDIAALTAGLSKAGKLLEVCNLDGINKYARVLIAEIWTENDIKPPRGWWWSVRDRKTWVSVTVLSHKEADELKCLARDMSAGGTQCPEPYANRENSNIQEVATGIQRRGRGETVEPHHSPIGSCIADVVDTSLIKA